MGTWVLARIIFRNLTEGQKRKFLAFLLSGGNMALVPVPMTSAQLSKFLDSNYPNWVSEYSWTYSKCMISNGDVLAIVMHNTEKTVMVTTSLLMQTYEFLEKEKNK